MCLCVCSSRCSILAVSFFHVHYSLVNRPIRPLRAFVYIPAGILRVPVKPRQQDPSLVKSIMCLSYNLNTRVQTADQIITIMHTVFWSESGENRLRSSSVYKTKQLWTNISWSLMWETTADGGSIIIDYAHTLHKHVLMDEAFVFSRC